MMNFAQLLAKRTDAIIDRWMEAVKQDRYMTSDDTLTPTAVRDHLPLVLEAMVTILSRTEDDDVQTLVAASLQHGVLRAEQGFEPAEIAREYRLLRRAIFETLQPELVQEAGSEVFRVFSLIDAVVDEAIAQCFKSYIGERLKELEQVQDQAAMAGQEMSRLVRTSQDSVSQLTDELKAPLNVIIGYSELLLRQQRQILQPQDVPSEISHIERVLRNSRQLLRLINDATELSRYETGNLQLHLIPTNPGALIQQIVQVMHATIAAKNLHVKIDCETAPIQVLTDPLRLEQIITNLLSNAVHFTNAGSVEVRCLSGSDDRWSIVITDTGVGIASENLSRIFEPYFRVDPGDQAHMASRTGLGLAIVQRLVNLLQGEINVVSEPGVGSTFTVTLPKTLTLSNSGPVAPPA